MERKTKKKSWISKVSEDKQKVKQYTSYYFTSAFASNWNNKARLQTCGFFFVSTKAGQISCSATWDFHQLYLQLLKTTANLSYKAKIARHRRNYKVPNSKEKRIFYFIFFFVQKRRDWKDCLKNCEIRVRQTRYSSSSVKGLIILAK